MTAIAASGRSDVRAVGLISLSHFSAHFFMFLLPPLLPVLRQDLAVDYVSLGVVVTTYHLTSGITQIPMGFLIDRYGARSFLIGGVAVKATAFGLMGFADGLPALIGLMAVAGIANSVFHPADYSILSASVSGRRMGRAFSVHTFAGYLGNAAAPLAISVSVSVSLWDWHVALWAAGIGGWIVVLLLWLNRHALRDRPDGEPSTIRQARASVSDGLSLLFSLPIVMCVLFFFALALSAGGLNQFGVVGFIEVQGVSLISANLALTGFLGGGAVGILIGGYIADRTDRHERVAALGFGLTALLVLLVANLSLSAPVLVALMVAAGLLHGMIMPSRDMLVRAVTPEGAMGKVFAFATVGFAAGGVITPLIFGWLLDNADPVWLFRLVALFMGFALITVFVTRASRGPEPREA